MQSLILDFESFFDPATGYTLTKMPTQQYVRDARFECLGAAVAVAGDSRWIPPSRLAEFFARIDWPRTRLVCHNARFDYTVLRQHWPYLPRPAEICCTRDLARYAVSQGWLPADQRVGLGALMPRYGLTKGDTLAATTAGGAVLEQYATTDAIATCALHDEFAWRVPRTELDLIDLHARMAAEPVLDLDLDSLAALAQARPDPLAAKLRSKALFAAALRRCGVEPETKQGKNGPDFAFAKTDSFMQSLTEHTDPRVQMLATLRLEGQSNIVRTRAARLLACGAPLGVPLAYYAAHTGRAGGADGLNLQNLPARNPDAVALRHALRAPPGYTLLIVDSAQIEVRVNAWLGQQADLLTALRSGIDPYTAYAAKALSVPLADVTKAQRQWAKAPVLAFGFGQGANGYLRYCQRSGIPKTDTQAREECDQWRALHPQIMSSWSRHEHTALSGVVRLPSGRNLLYPDQIRQNGENVYLRPAIFSPGSKRVESRLWHGLATENVVQAIARDVVMHQILECCKVGLRCALTVHDEGVFVVPETDAEEAALTAARIFSTAPDWAEGLPLAASTTLVEHYGK